MYTCIEDRAPSAGLYIIVFWAQTEVYVDL